MAVDEKDKREKYIKFLFELEELPEAFMALQVLLFILSLSCNGHYVIFVDIVLVKLVAVLLLGSICWISH